MTTPGGGVTFRREGDVTICVFGDPRPRCPDCVWSFLDGLRVGGVMLGGDGRESFVVVPDRHAVLDAVVAFFLLAPDRCLRGEHDHRALEARRARESAGLFRVMVEEWAARTRDPDPILVERARSLHEEALARALAHPHAALIAGPFSP